MLFYVIYLFITYIFISYEPIRFIVLKLFEATLVIFTLVEVVNDFIPLLDVIHFLIVSTFFYYLLFYFKTK